MYCKRCHHILTNDDLICTNCNFDNHEDYIIDKTKELEIISLIDKKESKASIIITSIAIILTCCILFLYIIHDSKALKSRSFSTFTYENLTITYPDTFKIQDNILYYMDQDKLFIQFQILSDEEYQNLIWNYPVENSQIGALSTLSYRNTTEINHIFTFQNKNYMVSIHFANEEILKDQEIHVDLQSILNSFKLKEQ